MRIFVRRGYLQARGIYNVMMGKLRVGMVLFWLNAVARRPSNLGRFLQQPSSFVSGKEHIITHWYMKIPHLH